MMNEPLRDKSCLCEPDSTRLSNISSSLFRCQMDQGCKKFTTQAIASLIALKRRSFRFELTTNEGEPAAKLSTSNQFLKAAVREKNSPASSTDCRAQNLRFQ